MANKAMVRLDDPRFAGRDADVFSVRAETALQNGFVGKLGDLEVDNLDVRKLEISAAEDSLVLIANPVRIYDNARRGSDLEINYEMKAGEAVRAYGLKPTYVFSITKEAVNGAATVGEYLVSGAGNKLVPSATVPASGFAAKVVKEEAVGGKISVATNLDPTNYVILEVVQN